MIIGRFDAAKIEFEQGEAAEPEIRGNAVQPGQAVFHPGQLGRCAAGVRGGHSPRSAYMEAYDGLGFALEALGDDAGAVANYRKAIEMNEAAHAAFASPYVNLSALSNRTGDREAALDYARKALEANPKSDRALFQMAKAYEYRGDLHAAADALNRAIASELARPPPISTCSPPSTGNSAGWRRAGRRWRRSSSWIASPTSWSRSAASS